MEAKKVNNRLQRNVIEYRVAFQVQCSHNNYEYIAESQKKGNGRKYGREYVGESEKEEERGIEEAEVLQGGREGGEEGKERREMRVEGARRGHQK